MYSALTLVFLSGSASAETGYNRNATKLAAKPVDGVNPLIVGGDPVTPNEHNWVLQWRGDGYLCGASLIDEQWAMIAAHCTKGIPASKMEVFVYRHAIDGGADEHKCAETLKVDEKFEHPDYDERADNDIALLRLSRPVGCAGSITMPLLDDGSYSGADTTATVAGWGVTSKGGSVPDVLLSVDLKLLTNAKCGKSYGYEGRLTDSMICAIGDLKGGEDACQGDSGGPLFVQQGGVDIIVGIVSWGRGCARKRIAGVYARVSSFQSWIEETSGVATGKFPPQMPSPPSSPPASPSPPFSPPSPPSPSPPPSPPTSCECSDTSTGCLSGGQDVSDRCGCSTHGLAGETPFCYVVEPTRCPSAEESNAIVGAAWVDCAAPSQPPSSPQSPCPDGLKQCKSGCKQTSKRCKRKCEQTSKRCKRKCKKVQRKCIKACLEKCN